MHRTQIKGDRWIA